MNDKQIEKRIDQLTDKIPAGTYCSDGNNCGGYLTEIEVEVLELLYALQRERLLRKENRTDRLERWAIRDFCAFLVECGLVTDDAADELQQAYFYGAG